MAWWRIDGWPTPEEWQAFWALTTLVVAIAAACVALVHYRLSVRSRIEQARPYVHVDYVFDRTMILFEVKNTGLTAAEEVTFEWSPLPRSFEANATAAIHRALVEHGIPFLAPGRSLRYYVGAYEPAMAEIVYRVKVRYRGSADQLSWGNESVLDIRQWTDVAFEHDPLESAAVALAEISIAVKELAASTAPSNVPRSRR